MNGPEGEPDAGTEQFSHDAIGNRVQEHRFLSDPQNPDNGIRNYTVSLTGQVSQITSDASIQSAFYSQENYEYDNAGNTIHDYGNERRSSGSPMYNNYWESRSYYGADEKLRVYSRFAGIGPNSDPAMAGHRAVYEETWYDALGRRVMVRSRRDANCGSLPVFPDDCVSSLQRYVWDGDQVLYEIRTDGSDSTTWDAMSLNSPSTLRNLPFNAYGVVGYTHITGIDVPSLIFKSTTSAGLQVLVPHVNWRGVFDSANVISGAVPSVRWPGRTETLDAAPATANALYDWFGDLSGGNTTGSGQKYMRNRYYDPTTGKFTQEDPIGIAGGMNLYGFAGGDPVNFSDPFGLCGQKGEEPCKIDNSDGLGWARYAGAMLKPAQPVLEAAGNIEMAFMPLGEAGAITKLGLSEGKAAAVEQGIYEFTATSGKAYVGQSGNISQRLLQHVRSGKLAASDMTSVSRTEVLGGKTAREIAEQRRINQLGGIVNLENKVNPIGPARQHLLTPP